MFYGLLTSRWVRSSAFTMPARLNNRALLLVSLTALSLSVAVPWLRDLFDFTLLVWWDSKK